MAGMFTAHYKDAGSLRSELLFYNSRQCIFRCSPPFFALYYGDWSLGMLSCKWSIISFWGFNSFIYKKEADHDIQPPRRGRIVTSQLCQMEMVHSIEWHSWPGPSSRHRSASSPFSTKMPVVWACSLLMILTGMV